MAEKGHSVASVLSRHPLHAISEFDDEAERDAHTYTAADIGKAVATGTGSGRQFWLIVDVVGSTATFRELAPAGGGGGASPVSERYAVPENPHALDEEFDTTSLSNFTLYDASGNVVSGQPVDTTIDPYSNDSANSHAVAHTYKRSWLTFKCRNNNARHYFLKSVTLATNNVIWTRIGQKIRAVDNAATIGLVLLAQSGSNPDPNNRVEIRLENTSSGRRFICQVVTAGSVSSVFTGGTLSGDTCMPWYLVVHKLGTNWHFWIGAEAGGLCYLGTGSQASTHLYAGFVFHVNDATPGNGIDEADFLRFVASATFLP